MTRACPKEDQMTELITEARAIIIIIIIANMYRVLTMRQALITYINNFIYSQSIPMRKVPLLPSP